MYAAVAIIVDKRRRGGGGRRRSRRRRKRRRRRRKKWKKKKKKKEEEEEEQTGHGTSYGYGCPALHCPTWRNGSPYLAKAQQRKSSATHSYRCVVYSPVFQRAALPIPIGVWCILLCSKEQRYPFLSVCGVFSCVPKSSATHSYRCVVYSPVFQRVALPIPIGVWCILLCSKEQRYPFLSVCGVFSCVPKSSATHSYRCVVYSPVFQRAALPIPIGVWCILLCSKEQRYPFLSVCGVFSCVPKSSATHSYRCVVYSPVFQTVVWLPVLGICNARTDVDACDFTRGLYRHRKRVCTGS